MEFRTMYKVIHIVIIAATVSFYSKQYKLTDRKLVTYLARCGTTNARFDYVAQKHNTINFKREIDI